MKLLLVDFDKTLANITDYKEKMVAGISEKCHTDVGTINQMIHNLFTAYGIIDWEPFYSQTMALSSLSHEDIKKLLFEPMKYVTLNQNVASFTKNFEGYKILFSYGEHDFQDGKIQITKSYELVNSVWITQTPKIQALAKKIKGLAFEYEDQIYEDITLIDDNETFLQEVRDQFSFIKVINVKELL